MGLFQMRVVQTWLVQIGKVETGAGSKWGWTDAGPARQRGCKLEDADAGLECRDAFLSQGSQVQEGERLVHCNVGRGVKVRERKDQAGYMKM